MGQMKEYIIELLNADWEAIEQRLGIEHIEALAADANEDAGLRQSALQYVDSRADAVSGSSPTRSDR